MGTCRLCESKWCYDGCRESTYQTMHMHKFGILTVVNHGSLCKRRDYVESCMCDVQIVHETIFAAATMHSYDIVNEKSEGAVIQNS